VARAVDGLEVHALGQELLDATVGGVARRDQVARAHLGRAGDRGLGRRRADEPGREAESCYCDRSTSDLRVHA
jgi:hypothetical protein